MFNNLRIDKNRTAIIENGVKYTYDDLEKYSLRITDNIKTRFLVLFMCDNSYDALAAYYGFINKKIVVMLVKTVNDMNYLQTIMNAYHPNYIYCPAEIQVDADWVSDFGSYRLYQLNNKSMKMFDELAVLLSTSGSTGSPRFVRLSYGNLVSNTEQIIDALKIVDHDRVITILPLYYTYGLSIVNTHLYQGASIVLNKYSVMSTKFWDLIREQSVTTFGGVPFTYEYICKRKIKLHEFPSIRYVTQAGGALAGNVLDYFLSKETGVPFIKMYGQVEGTARIAVMPWAFATRKHDSVGKVVKNGKVTIIKENGNVSDCANIKGEICYQGPNVMLGYSYNANDLIKEDECKGSIMTGDIGFLDEEGFLYIIGRKKRFVKVCGERISLDEIENNLKTMSCVCACKGEDNNIKVYLESGDPDTVIHYMVNRLNIQRMYFNIYSVKYLPRNEAGKIKYSSI
ncbi:AMP-binding protein [Anaerocolumna sp. MB42-C2]|uniref:AMP-binding protein n=1 Tax=Anaerocolumna sp. MB42-C2 TaxID=3070997 RepID=UPI0027E0AF9F|nr:AMP-binding protein [Anaerocolumna sp. MB42-C2]WMJ86455.1 AMP-binding protein [Anaerocolumna sp. MB42-C2]